jgi:hypothetical protein
MRLDHVSYAVPAAHLADEVQRIGAAIGGTFRDGGRHPRFGTRNFVCPLGGGAYVEVVSALDHPAADKSPFGRAVKARGDAGGGWWAWVVAVDDIAPVEERLGRSSARGNRHRPDGFDLQWQQIGVNDLADAPQVPFFVQWTVDAAEHPSAGADELPRIDALELAGDPSRVGEWLGSSSPDSIDGIELRWVEAEASGLVAVHLSTRSGAVRLD